MKQYLIGKKYSPYLFLLAIIIFDLLILSYYVYKKDVLFCDEAWSYTFANAPIQTFGTTDNPYFETWKTQEDYRHLFTPAPQDRFTYARIIDFKKTDVHGPLYFFILHTISSMFPESLSLGIPLSINYVAFILIILFLFKSAREFGSDKSALLMCFIFSISAGSIMEVLFIRMYELVCAFVVMSLYYHIVLLKPIFKGSLPDRKTTNISLLMIAVLYFLGYLTHYSFIVFAFITSFTTLIVIFIKNRNKDILGQYTIFSCLPFIISFIIHPHSFLVLFGKIPRDSGGIIYSLLNRSLYKQFGIFWDLSQEYLSLNYLLIAGIISSIICVFNKLIKVNSQISEETMVLSFKPKYSFDDFKISINTFNTSFLLFFSFIFIASYLFLIKTCYFNSLRFVWMIIPIFYLILAILIRSKYSLKIFLIFALFAAANDIRDYNFQFYNHKPDSKVWLEENKLDTILYYKESDPLYFVGDATWLIHSPRSYITTDLSKHIDTRTDRVVVIFSNQLYDSDKGLPAEYVEKVKTSLGFREAGLLFREYGKEFWILANP